MASTFDLDLLRRTANATGYEVRAKNNDAARRGIYVFHTGLSCWSPVINIARHPLWGRLQETYGEDPVLNGEMAAAFVAGLQGNASDRYLLTNAGCKHFAGFAGPLNANGDHIISERDMQTTYLPQFKRCVEAGAWSFMCSYSAINGVPSCGSKKLLTDTLRDEWKFEGYVVSDQTALEQIAGTKFPHSQPAAHGDQPAGYPPYNKSNAMAAALIATAGCDLEDSNWNNSAATPAPGGHSNVFQSLPDAVAQGLVEEATIDRAVKRLVGVRLRLGEFDPPAMTQVYTGIGLDVVQSDAHRALAEEATRKSLVLLKNTKSSSARKSMRGEEAEEDDDAKGRTKESRTERLTLPLSAARLQGKSIAVVGPFADGLVSGKSDQPARGNLYYGDYGAGSFKKYWGPGLDPWPNQPDARNYTVTVREALAKRAAAAGATLRVAAGCVSRARPFGQASDVCNRTSYDRAAVAAAAAHADVVLVCLGASKYVEAEGVDRADLALPGAQGDLLQDVAHAVDAAGSGAAVVLVLFNAGGLDVSWAASSESVGAIVAAGYPGQTTGTALMDVLFGDVAPSGKLAVTWPKSLAQVPKIGDYRMAGTTFRYAQPDPLYPFGFGLSYVTFAYSALSLHPRAPKPCDGVAVHVTVANTGRVAADEVVLAFVEWAHAPHPTPNRSLVAFTRVHLAPGSSRDVKLEISPRRLAVLAVPGLDGAASTWMAAPVSVRIHVGGQQPQMAVRAPSNVLAASFEVVGDGVPLSDCERVA